MPTPTKGARLGGSPAHEKKILANLAASLFEHRSITTTVTKAKRLSPFAERLITKAKQGDLAARRQVAGKISASNATNQAVVHELFTVIAPAMAERNGGYTRITKIGSRKGDNAPMAVIELVMEPVSPKQQVVRDAESAVASAAPAEVASPESEDSPDSPDSPDSADSPDSPESADSADSPEEAAEAAEDGDAEAESK